MDIQSISVKYLSDVKVVLQDSNCSFLLDIRVTKEYIDLFVFSNIASYNISE